MPPKQTQDPIQNLRNIDASQTGGGFEAAQPEGEKQEAPKQEKEKRTVDVEAEARDWASRYDIAKTYQTPMFQKWGKWYDDMYAHVNDQSLAPWRSQVYLPILASKVWDLISRFVQYRPGWDVSVRTLPINTLDKEGFDLYMEQMNRNVEKIKMKLNYDYDCPLMEDPIQDELLDRDWETTICHELL